MLKPKLIRITTVPISLEKLLGGQLGFMQQYFSVTAISSEEIALNRIGKKEGVAIFCLHMTRKITIIQDVKAVWHLYWFLKKQHTQIVHTHTPKAGIVGMLASKLSGVPHRLHTVAGLPLLESSGLKRIILDIVEKTTYACATKVYPNSFGLKDIILQNELCSESKIQVIGNGSSNGIDTQYFSRDGVTPELLDKLKQKYKITQTNFVFIFVGRLVTDKGINELVKAFNKISPIYPKAKLLLVGNLETDIDPLRKETELILQNNPAIILTGYQSDVRPFFSIADVLTFPSYREGFPNVVMQAGAMEIASIVTNINGCNEIIQNNINGIIIPPKNVHALEEAMIEMMENPESRKQLAQNARPLIIERYEQRMVWELIKQEYDEQLKKASIIL